MTIGYYQDNNAHTATHSTPILHTGIVMALTDHQVKSLKPKEKRYSKTDSKGLSIDVMPTGKKSWTLTLNKNGKRTRIKIGSYPLISLKEARAKATKLLREAELGLVQISLSQVLDDWFATYSRQWSSEKYKYTVSYRLDLVTKNYAHKDIADVTRSDIANAIERLVAEGKIETANRSLRLLNSVFTYAQVKDYVKDNPCFKVDAIIPSREVKNMPSLAFDDMPEFWQAVNKMQMNNQTRYALMLFNYLAVRPSELVKAEWGEFDLEAGTWLIPAHRMKMKKEHLVPLSRQPLELLKQIYADRAQDKYVFTHSSDPSRPMPIETPLAAIKRSGYAGQMVTHGFRSLFSTHANESQKFSDDVIERCLAHVPRNKIRAAYNRAEYWQHRVELMAWWADIVEGWLT